jgi:hypothetical protein
MTHFMVKPDARTRPRGIQQGPSTTEDALLQVGSPARLKAAGTGVKAGGVPALGFSTHLHFELLNTIEG